MKKILFLSSYNASFVQNDLEILQKHYEVIRPDITGKNKIQVLFEILRVIPSVDLVFCWFAEFPAFVSSLFTKIFRKKIVVVIGGYEAANVPEINYGGLLDEKVKKKVQYIIEHSDLILAVSTSSLEEIKSGYRINKIKKLYNAVDPRKFYPDGEKQDVIVTVSNVKTSNLKRKGLETYTRVANYLQDHKFILIGKHSDDAIIKLRNETSDNVIFTGYVSDVQLLKYLQKAKVYVQVSAHEGFGVSIAEAMLCECVPVVTDRGAIREVVGDTGFYVSYNAPKETAEAIKQALESDNGKRARSRIMQKYSLQKREKELVKIISGLCKI